MHLILAPKDTEVELPWEHATEYCENLDIDGYTTWKLPTRFELGFLIQHYPHKFTPTGYWTSTERWHESPGADFIDGGNPELYLSCWKETKLLVRAIRRCGCIQTEGHKLECGYMK